MLRRSIYFDIQAFLSPVRSGDTTAHPVMTIVIFGSEKIIAASCLLVIARTVRRAARELKLEV